MRFLFLLAATSMLAKAAMAAPAPTYAPRPAVIAPRAASGLMLDVVATGERFVAVGERGQILRSDDGRNWTQSPVPVRAALTAVSFADPSHGWAVGHDAVILNTADGGQTWALQNYEPELEKPLLDVLFVDARRGFAVGAFGLFLRTEDGGANWSPVAAPVIDEDELNLYAITRLGNGDLLIVGEQGRLVLSTDGGQTWKKLRSPARATLFGASALGSSGVMICGLRGQAWTSDAARNGGWKAIDTGTAQALYACSGFGRDRAVLAGAEGTVLLADLDTRSARRLKSPAGGAWSTVAVAKTGVVLGGERGLHLLAPAPAR